MPLMKIIGGGPPLQKVALTKSRDGLHQEPYEVKFTVLKNRATPENSNPFVFEPTGFQPYDPDLLGARTYTDFSGRRYPCDFYGSFSTSMRPLLAALNARFGKQIESMELSERRLHMVFVPQPPVEELLELARMVGEFDRPYTRYEAILEEDDDDFWNNPAPGHLAPEDSG